eukprot:CAMPEP_0116062638 /NCGR_PEP_ID=MMETSP0322-20121206/7899_1 /TAXON_ID=163516 /ORGANISM="Leptocylindrus danicus var. apora, Strain B651" /LENGTH=350 /DNA_ID=CAMNT_0003548025 /DNA_START=259 /DNA_END=1307 /DNA_ORIENTATION=+
MTHKTTIFTVAILAYVAEVAALSMPHRDKPPIRKFRRRRRAMNPFDGQGIRPNGGRHLMQGDYFNVKFKLPHIDPTEDGGAFAPPFPCQYTNDPATVRKWIDQFVYNSEGCYFVGFDTESVPNAPWMTERGLKPGPATVQLSTTESSLVVHLTHCYGKFPDALGELLYDDEIVKVGVGIDDDLLDLYRHFGPKAESRCRFDIGGIGSPDGKMMISLKRLTMSVAGIDLPKSKKTARSNWARFPLTKKQLCYSARDAWAAAIVLQNLSGKRPDIFGDEALLSLVVGSERSMHEIDIRAKKRKEAKVSFKQLLYKIKKLHTIELNEETQKELDDLEALMRLLRPDGMFVFDP